MQVFNSSKESYDDVKLQVLCDVMIVCCEWTMLLLFVVVVVVVYVCV